jgi:hypothetical protein
MTVFPFLATAALRQDLDRPLLATLPPSKPPIFVLGLHRSGTTFLYQLLADSFPFAVTTLYDITHYRRLLWAEREGLTAVYRAELRDHLEARGLTTRGIDSFQVSPDALEEYAFILRKFSSRWGFGKPSRAIFDELLLKMSALHPESAALLLKNPHDLITVNDIKACYPDAKFIFIRRDPVRVLNSQFRNSFLYRKQPEPYLDLLLAGVPLWRFAFRLMAWANHFVPDRVYQKLLISGLRRSLHAQLATHYQELSKLDPACYVEVSYEQLLQDPALAFASVQKLTGIAPHEGIAIRPPSPRHEPLLGAVEKVATSFRRQLAGIPDAAIYAEPNNRAAEVATAI